MGRVLEALCVAHPPVSCGPSRELWTLGGKCSRGAVCGPSSRESGTLAGTSGSVAVYGLSSRVLCTPDGKSAIGALCVTHPTLSWGHMMGQASQFSLDLFR